MAHRATALDKEEMREMRLAGMTFEAIAKKFDRTRESVRQILGALKRPGSPRPDKWRTKHWFQTMRGWLHEQGIYRCRACQTWKEEIIRYGRCKDCNRLNLRRYLATEHGKQKLREWNQNNSERLKEYQRRYYRKKFAEGKEVENLYFLEPEEK